MNTKNIVLSLIASLAFVFSAGLSPVRAQACTTQYGAETSCQTTDLTINKQVRNVASGAFVENLSATDSTFAPGSEVTYRLTIKNSSGETFNPVVVRDVLPSFLTFVSGPGTYDAGSNTLTVSLENVIAGETRTVEFQARVANTESFSGKSFVCVNNYAEVKVLNRFDSDTAQICLQNNVLGATTLPVAGSNDYLLLLPFAGVGLTGIALLKKRG